MRLKIHGSWIVVFLAIFIIVADVTLAIFGVVRRDEAEAVVIFDAIAEGFSERVADVMDAEAAGLGAGYLLGTKDKLSAGLKNKIQIVGLSHVIVVSGTHLGIIVGWARKIFGKISRNAGVYFAILLMVVYVGIVGFTPSLMRSGLVTVLTLLAWRTGRKFESWRILLIVAAMTLCYNPTYILNVSWQLSMAAYAGILVLMPILREFFYGPMEKVGLFGSTVLASLAATVMCLPISLYYFGSVSLLSFVANLLILPTVAMAMGLTLMAGIFGGVFAVLAEWVLKYHINVVNFLSQYDSLMIEVGKGDALVFVWYLPVVALVGWRAWRNYKRRRERVRAVRNMEWRLEFSAEQDVEIS